MRASIAMEAFTGDRARTTRPPPTHPPPHSPSFLLTLLFTLLPTHLSFPLPFFPPHSASFSSSLCVFSEVVSPNIHISKEQSAPAFFTCNTRSSERSLLAKEGLPSKHVLENQCLVLGPAFSSALEVKGCVLPQLWVLCFPEASPASCRPSLRYHLATPWVPCLREVNSEFSWTQEASLLW